MTERDAFLAAIAANPDDDLPKLVFADWLDERNDPAAFEQREAVALRRVLAAPEDDRPRQEYAAVCEQYANCAGNGEFSDGRKERAEFIRVQCELAKLNLRNDGLPLRDYPGQDFDRRLTLEKRERDLWVQYCTQWFRNPNRLYRYNAGHPEYVAGGIVFNAIRGFVSHVRCSLDDWCGGVCDWSGYSGDHSECRHCGGTGRTPALGPPLVRRQPITTVRVNLTPVVERFDGSALAHWTDIPADVHRHLGANEWSGRTAGEATENAHQGLSTALIAWAKWASALIALENEAA